MTLARAAAERALQDMASPPPTTPTPCSSAAAIEQADERARHRTPDYGRTFAHISRAVRQTILLETHLADGRAHAHSAESRPPTPQDRVSQARPSTDTEPETTPHCETLRREPVERLDCEQASTPSDDAAIETLLCAIADTLGRPIAPTQTPVDGHAPQNPDLQPPRPHPPNLVQRTAGPVLHPPRAATRQPGQRW